MGIFRMPSLGADMETGTLAEWLVKPGDTVKRGDIVAVVETQKGAIEIEIFEDGPVTELMVEEGQQVPVGTPIAVIGDRAKPAKAAPPPEEQATASGPLAAPPPPANKAAPAPAAPARPAMQEAPRPAGEIKASPAARKLAGEHGIDLAILTGSGPDGAIVFVDVERAVAGQRGTPPVAPMTQGPARRGPDMGEMRRAIAAAMARSKREIPHYYVAHAIDAEPLFAWLEHENAQRSPEARLLYAAPLLKAVALAIADFPEMNGHYGAEGFQSQAGAHIGVATAVRGGGLIAPAIHNVGDLSLEELMARLRDLVARVRRGGLRSSELGEATITLTSLGERGADQVWGVITPPQVAIVGVGSPRTRAWAMADGTLAARRVIAASLAADHRVSDGHRGALFLARIDSLLQDPETL